MSKVNPQDLNEFLNKMPEGGRDIAVKARELILSVMPDTIEQLDPTSHMIAYGSDRTYKGAICGIAIFNSYINIMIARGASLPDPQGILTGTGKIARHIRINHLVELEDPRVRAMLVTALTLHDPTAKK